MADKKLEQWTQRSHVAGGPILYGDCAEVRVFILHLLVTDPANMCKGSLRRKLLYSVPDDNIGL